MRSKENTGEVVRLEIKGESPKAIPTSMQKIMEEAQNYIRRSYSRPYFATCLFWR